MLQFGCKLNSNFQASFLKNLKDLGKTENLQCIKYFKQFESLIKKNKNYAITLSTLIGLHKIAANQYYNGKELPPRYDDLINVLRLSIKALKY